MKNNMLNNKPQQAGKGAVGIVMTLMTIALLLAPTKAWSQVLLDEDNYGSPRATTEGVVYEFEIVPFMGGDGDQFLPLGEGWLLLGGFGVAYLLTKRKKHQED